MQQLLVSPNIPYHQDFELLLVQPVDYKIKNSWIKINILEFYLPIVYQSIVLATIYEIKRVIINQILISHHVTLADHISMFNNKDQLL